MRRAPGEGEAPSAPLGWVLPCVFRGLGGGMSHVSTMSPRWGSQLEYDKVSVTQEQ